MSADWDPPRSPGPKLPEARDRAKAKRDAWGRIEWLIDRDLRDGIRLGGAPSTWSAEERDMHDEMKAHRDALRAASRVEDSPNLSEVIDGTPPPGKCKDPECSEHASKGAPFDEKLPG